MAIPSVNDKNVGLLNTVAVDVKSLQLEDVENQKSVAILPAGHPSIAGLNARHSAIQNSVKNHS